MDRYVLEMNTHLLEILLLGILEMALSLVLGWWNPSPPLWHPVWGFWLLGGAVLLPLPCYRSAKRCPGPQLQSSHHGRELWCCQSS